jgi:hypothetical protein
MTMGFFGVVFDYLFNVLLGSIIEQLLPGITDAIGSLLVF